MNEQGGFEIRIRMTPEQGVEFLELLADDDDFRKRFETEPQALLADWGIDVPEEALPERVVPPSRGMLLDARDQLRASSDEAAIPWFFPPFSGISGFAFVFIALHRARFGPREY